MRKVIQSSQSLAEVMGSIGNRHVYNVDKAQFVVRVGEHIEYLRRKSGMNISEFLEAVGIAKSHTYTRIRQGDNPPSLWIFSRMVQVLGPELLEVFDGRDLH